jgi:hypothetical protein
MIRFVDMVNYALYIGIALCVLSILMRLGMLDFLLGRYEGFQKVFRKRSFNLDRKGLSNYYSILFLVVGALLLIGGVIILIGPNNVDIITNVTYIVVIVIGLFGMLYLNLTSKFLNIDDSTK